MPGFISNLYVWVVFSFGIILYASPNLHFAYIYFCRLGDFFMDAPYHKVWPYLQTEFWVILLVGILFCYPLRRKIEQRLFVPSIGSTGFSKVAPGIAELGFYAGLLLLSMAAMASSTYSPFIYFRF
jgi:hypothetical protein